MKLYPILFLAEGGWASTKTQGTKITPGTIEVVRRELREFQDGLNRFLEARGLYPVEIGHPVGSGTYYKRDMEVNPGKEYGDIDVPVFMTPDPGKSPNQNAVAVGKAVEAYCKESPECDSEKFESLNDGSNLLVRVGEKDQYVQVDLMPIYHEHRDWVKILRPEWNLKGTVCTSLLSALGEQLNVSVGTYGIQAKKDRDTGVVVKFSVQKKGTEVHTVTTNRASWGLDLVRWLGFNKPSRELLENPGMAGDETKVANTAAVIRGIALSIPESQGGGRPLLDRIKSGYLAKIDKVVGSSKFDKAETPEALAKAEKTKETLRRDSARVAAMLC